MVNPDTRYAQNLDIIVESASRRAMQYEVQMRDLESRLALDLSNSRAVDSKLREVVRGLDQTKKLTSRTLSTTVPLVVHSLSEDKTVLNELGEDLPEIGSQVRDIRRVYDSGRGKAKQLVQSLEWLDTPVPLRLRTIIFTPHAPVAKKWKVLFRTLFALMFLTCVYIAYITLRGALRAHRQRLVWGERLMS